MKALVFFGLLLFIGTACEDYLDEVNRSAITQENFFTTAAQAQEAVNGIYPGLWTLTSHSAPLNYGEAVFVSLEMLPGHASTLGQSFPNNGLIHHNNSADEPQFQVLWIGFYEGIANANFTIEGIPFAPLNESQKNALLGEAYFLRALYYYYLVRLYGDVPLIKEKVDFGSPDLYPKRSTIQQVYDFIISDLKLAETSGLPNVDNTGKASLGAVKSLLASVYLTMAGSPLNKGAEYYTLAANKAAEVLDWYVLFDNYDKLHDRADKNKGEFIFQVQYEYSVQSGGISAFVTPDKSGVSVAGSEIGALVPIPEFAASYDPNDKRASEKGFFFTEYPLAGNPSDTARFGPHLWKFWLEEALGTNGDAQPDLNWTILRLPEVMLIYAEASNEVNGPTQSAYDQVNLIRTRAELPPLSGLTKEEFRAAIWKERYHELCYENKSYFDIQRTRKAFNLATGNFEDALSYTNESGSTFTEKYMLWAIPTTEINANTNLTQNPGW